LCIFEKIIKLFMKNNRVLLLSVTALFVLYGCKKKNETPPNTASVMFVNGCAGTIPGIDAKVDNVNVGGALNVSFTNNSGYKLVKAGSPVTIGYFLTNVGTPVSSQSVTLTSGAHYSAFSAGLITSPSFVLASDDMTAPGTSNAKIRFVNLSNDGMSVTATAQNTVIDSGVTAMKVTSYIQVPAANYELKAGDPTNINTVVSTGVKTLAAGKIYTLMLTGSLAGTGVSALKLTLINNN
jgi:hypothetical protein